MTPMAIPRAPQRQTGWMYAVALHLLAGFLLLMLGRQLGPHIPRDKPVIPVTVIFGDVGQGERIAAPSPAPRETTPRPARVRPDAPRPTADPLDAKLAALAQLRAPNAGIAESAGAGGSGGGYTIRDLVRAQILRHWGVTAGAAPVDVALHIVIARSGVLLQVAVVDQARFAGDAPFRDVAISARNAATLSSPFELPQGVAASALDFIITLNPRDASR